MQAMLSLDPKPTSRDVALVEEGGSGLLCSLLIDLKWYFSDPFLSPDEALHLPSTRNTLAVVATPLGPSSRSWAIAPLD